MASWYIGHEVVSGGPLGGLFGGSICLLVLSHISVRWGPPKLKVGALRLQGIQCLSGPERKGTNTLEALDRLKNGLGIRYNDEAAESVWEILALAWGCHGRWFGIGQRWYQ